MSWILTHSGRQVDPLAARGERLQLGDIAHALSLSCRFNGHCRVFYSVAEHSVRVSRLLASEHAAWGLLHDASEAYVGDLPRPLKQRLPEYCAIEDRLQQVIATRFGLVWPMPELVKRADDQLLATELRDLMPEDPELPPLPAPPLDESIQPWSAAEAERRFLQRCEELGLA